MRAIIDLPPVAWALPGTMPAPRGLIAGYRYGLFDPTTARLVVDLAGPARVRLVRYDLPTPNGAHRLVIEFEGTTQTAFDEQVQPWTHSVTKTARIVAPMPMQVPAAIVAPSPPAPRPPVAAAPAPPTPAPAQAAAPPRLAAVAPSPPNARPAPRRAEPKHVIALDAGHGGVDPGAIGIGGTFEKDVTLGMTREIRRQLEATGRYKVVLTRDEDIFVRLRDRIARARAGNAELFVSIHADSMRNKETRGASIYTLSEHASDDEAAALAARENRSDIIAGVDLSHENKEVMSILIDLAQRETMNHSAILGGLLVDELGREIPLISVKPHRFAGFAVLRAPDLPSALIELGYLSNRADEQLLTRPHNRAKVAASIVRAIDQFFVRRPARS
jgi:N-acetylmuramoyl-L-alanine amidase